MLAKCASPLCSAPFLHLADGRLFRLETEPALPSSNIRETEYFWLCEAIRADATLTLAHRQKGLMLRGVQGQRIPSILGVRSASRAVMD